MRAACGVSARANACNIRDDSVMVFSKRLFFWRSRGYACRQPRSGFRTISRLRGDYESLYSWLDTHESKECVDSLAILKYEYRRSLRDELKNDLKKNITTDKRTRILLYIVTKILVASKGHFPLVDGERRLGQATRQEKLG